MLRFRFIASILKDTGYPGYFRVELAIAKLLGAALLLLPVPPRLKEWAYAGFTITFISAFIAHAVSGDPATPRVMTVLLLAFLTGSYLSYHQLQKTTARTV